MVTCEPSSACSSLGGGLPAVKMRGGSEGVEPVPRKEDLILGEGWSTEGNPELGSMNETPSRQC